MLNKRTTSMVGVAPSASERRSPLDSESLSEGEGLLLGDTAGLLALVNSAIPSCSPLLQSTHQCQEAVLPDDSNEELWQLSKSTYECFAGCFKALCMLNQIPVQTLAHVMLL